MKLNYVNKIDLCCVQENEIELNYPFSILSSRKYEFEPELNNNKHRVGLFIDRALNYRRRSDLEKENCHLVIVDIMLVKVVRVITIYRSFSPLNNLTPFDFFMKQLIIIKDNIVPNTILLGDFNLDFEMQYEQDYSHKRYFEELNSIISQYNLHPVS
jgi:hypothetical protein